jgi:hypothetical protein
MPTVTGLRRGGRSRASFDSDRRVAVEMSGSFDAGRRGDDLVRGGEHTRMVRTPTRPSPQGNSQVPEDPRRLGAVA